jgi:hypothetical protein
MWRRSSDGNREILAADEQRLLLLARIGKARSRIR